MIARHPVPSQGRAASRMAICAGLLALTLAACTPHRELYPRLESLAAGGRYTEAAKLVEANKDTYGERNAVLYNLDRGVFYHYAGEYEASNRAFEAAEQRIDELFTTSVSGEVGAFMVNDNTLPYRGEDFEAVVINVYRALNYARLGDVDAALVEARKVDLKLTQINRQYEPQDRNAYREDAFARLLMGIFYEEGGTREDLNDAFISNRLAYSIYERSFAPNYGATAPTVLKRNLVTTASFMGPDELAQARDATGLAPESLDQRRRQARLVLVHYAGRSPVKVENSLTAVVGGDLIRVAFPGYRARSYLIHGSRARIGADTVVPLEEGQPTGAIAMRSLEDRRGRVAAKAIARAVTKYVANRRLQREAQDQGGGAGLLAFLLGNVYAVATEQADLRAWQTLPDKILIGSTFVEPGVHRVVVEFLTSGGGVVSTRDLGELDLSPGSVRFLILHTNT